MSGGQVPATAPTTGRIVHYVSHGTPVREDGSQAYASQCRAAVVTAVLPCYGGAAPCVSLAVFNPTGLHFDESVSYDASGAGGTWHWPERS